jgi:hypothetical protein
MGVILCLRSWGLLPNEADDDDEDGEDEVDEDIRKDWGYGRTDCIRFTDVVIILQLHL